MTNIISVFLAWNDWWGNCTHDLDRVAIDLGDDRPPIEIELPTWATARIVPKEQMLERFAGKWPGEGLKLYGAGIVPIVAHARHVGNIHNDQVKIHRQHLGRLLQGLHRLSGQMLAGPTTLFDVWQRDQFLQSELAEACE